MSLHYILDGYNVIHKMPSGMTGVLENERNRLIQWVATTRPQGSERNQITIVFDGQAGMGSSKESNHDIRIIFGIKSADFQIKEMVRLSSSPKQMVVISDDRDIQLAVRKMGGRIMSVGDFLSKAVEKSVIMRKRAALGMADKSLPSAAQRKITDECTELWVKSKNNKRLE